MRILDIVDSQAGFMAPWGNLYVDGGDQIIEPINNFFRKVPLNMYKLALAKYDTHLKETYHMSPESKLFPLHCEYQSQHWKLAINIKLLQTETFFMTKGTFDMWADESNETYGKYKNLDEYLRANNISSKTATALKNMNHICQDAMCLKPIAHRDQFFGKLQQWLHGSEQQSNGNTGGNTDTNLHNLRGLEVHIIGVASDYCNRFAMEGYLKRGATVVVLADLTRGIGAQTEEILQEEQYRKYADTGQLLHKASRDALNEMKR